MQITDIVLFSQNGERRILEFRPGHVNIITGSSNRGKSALIDIVDFCLGSRSCHISEGVILEKVAWFGLRLQLEDQQMFIARANPNLGTAFSGKLFYEQGDTVSIPDTIPTPNTTIEALRSLLTRIVGISPNLHTPPPGQVRLPLEANIRHSLIYCFQQQDEIASRSLLFHNQGEPHLHLAIKDTLPYFLGALREDQLALEQDITRAERDLRRAERALREAESLAGEGRERALGLLEEARRVGLLPPGSTPDTVEEIRAILITAKIWTPELIGFEGEDRLAQLQEEVRELRSQLQELSESVRSAKTFAEAASGFQEEAQQQQVRLESIGLFENTDVEPSTCPICSNALNGAIPTANALMSAIRRLRSSIDSTTGAKPRLREYIEELEAKKEAVRALMREKNAAIDGLLREEEAARAMRDLNARRAHVAGRISLWLENVEARDDHSILRSDVERAKRRLEELQDLLAAEDYRDRMTSILNRISIQMTDWAERIELEHSKNPIRLDISRLTVVVDKEDRPIPLTKMGGGQNWVGYHLVTHLALHKHFRQSQRPVPQFLFLDQPSQVYYPPERDAELQGSLEQVSNDDQLAVHRMYDLLFDAVEALSPSFQVIVLEHADLRDARFQDAVVERWRGRAALVPEDWPVIQNKTAGTE